MDKFRAWDGNEMYYPFEGENYITGFYFFEEEGIRKLENGEGRGHHREYIINWFTGLSDKNDKSIYEHDIIGFWPNYTNKPTGYKKGIVRYTDYKLVLGVNGLLYDAMEETDEGPYTWEILGNIYEDKELLEDG